MENDFFTKADRKSFIPLYKQVKAAIRKYIIINALGSGDVIPTQRELAEKMGVSRITVVKAIDELEFEGTLERIQGKGIFIADRRITQQLDTIIGFTESMHDQGLEIHSKVISHKIILPNLKIRNIFSLDPSSNQEFIQFKRLRFISGRPVSFIKATVQKEIGEEMLTYDLDDISFYDIYERVTGLRVTLSEQLLSMITLTNKEEEIIRHLQFSPNTSHFYLSGVGYQEGKIPVEFAESIFHGEFFQFKVSMKHLVIRQDIDDALRGKIQRIN